VTICRCFLVSVLTQYDELRAARGRAASSFAEEGGRDRRRAFAEEEEELAMDQSAGFGALLEVTSLRGGK
jgi:hypothetical protein